MADGHFLNQWAGYVKNAAKAPAAGGCRLKSLVIFLSCYYANNYLPHAIIGESPWDRMRACTPWFLVSAVFPSSLNGLCALSLSLLRDVKWEEIRGNWFQSYRAALFGKGHGCHTDVSRAMWRWLAGFMSLDPECTVIWRTSRFLFFFYLQQRDIVRGKKTRGVITNISRLRCILFRSNLSVRDRLSGLFFSNHRLLVPPPFCLL